MKVTSMIMAVGIFMAPTVLRAADDVVSVHLPDTFQIGRAPEGMEGFANPTATAPTPERTASTQEAAAGPSIERQQDAPLPRKYTVISPLYLGNDRNTISFIRFFNGLTQTASTNLLVVGNRSGHVYGTASVQAPVYSSPQYSIRDILTAANVPSSFVGNDDGYSLYLEDPANRGNNGFQHVIYNNDNGFFENASMCSYLNNERYEGMNQILINVHTSTLSQFPAFIYIHNYYTQTVSYTATVTDARNGQIIGQVKLQDLPPNTSYSVPFSYFETILNFVPRANQEHVNIIFSGAPGYYAIVGQMIYNSRFGSYVNMTHFCAINHYDPALVQ